ncbi:ABC transporter permease [Sinorhizobium meliloti]|uniref:ABC transporter permease n=1 Tax=Rhizobium meliloti TaxID=382 RepID=UPI000372CB18|nr:ABC transporter permease [Sinorhizobium meliloti]
MAISVNASHRGGDRAGLARASLPTIVLVLLVALGAAISPGVLSQGAVANFLVDATPLVILVIGATFPILTGSIDLSVAGVVSLTGVLLVSLGSTFGEYTGAVIVLAALVFGAAQGLVHVFFRLPSFIVSLGSLGILSGLALYISDSVAQPIMPGDILVDYISGGVGVLPNSLFVVLAVFVGLGLVVRYTRLGRDIFALGTGERAAMMSGVNVLATRMIAFAMSAGCAALAGLFLVSVTTFSSPVMAGNLLLLTIVGVVLGGTAISGGVGGLYPALVGGFLVAWLRVMIVIVGVPPTGQNIVFGVMALIAVAFTTDRNKLGIVK